MVKVEDILTKTSSLITDGKFFPPFRLIPLLFAFLLFNQSLLIVKHLKNEIINALLFSCFFIFCQCERKERMNFTKVDDNFLWCIWRRMVKQTQIVCSVIRRWIFATWICLYYFLKIISCFFSFLLSMFFILCTLKSFFKNFD